MKEIPLVQLVTESLEFCNHEFPRDTSLRWKVRPKHHFCDEWAWRRWNQFHAGRPAGKAFQDDESGEIYMLIQLRDYGGSEDHFLWIERVWYILERKEDHPDGEIFGGFFRKDQK